jgi:hypothetical protein
MHKRRIPLLIAALLPLALSAAALAAPKPAPRATPSITHPIHYFISIDGLQPDLLRALDGAGALTASKGLGDLYRHALVVDAATPVVSLTAASHVSTITCSPPSRHGIVANAYIVDGKKVSGYDHPFVGEPLWRAAMRQGKKVLSLAYVGSDGPTPERLADFGLGYPDADLIGPHQQLDWTLAALPAAQGWSAGATGARLDGAKEATITIVLNPKTQEAATLQVLLVPRDGGDPTIYVDNDKDLANGYLGTLGGGDDGAKIVDAYFTETNASSTMLGAKRRSFLRGISHAAGHVGLYVSKASYNAAYPASFRQRLDELNLVWPDYGVADPKLTTAEYLETQSMIDRFLTTVAEQVVPELDVDLVLFYQPLIDTLGHKLESALPRPFDPAATDEVTRAFVAAFQLVDADLGRLLAHTGPRDVVAAMGDHGMDPIRKAVNVAKLLPSDHIGKVEIVSSGSMTLLYAPANATPAQIAEAKAIGAGLRDKLVATSFEGAPIYGNAWQKDAFGPTPNDQGDYTREWQYGEALWAYSTASGFWLLYQPLTPDTFFDPPALGMHGQDIHLPTMVTAMMFRAPELRPEHRAAGSLIDAVPTFSRLVGMAPPTQCLGHSLVN